MTIFRDNALRLPRNRARPGSVFLVALAALTLLGCKARQPGSVEETIAQKTKEIAIGGKDWTNPTPDDEETIKRGTEHFQHHCQICHGLDGQYTGVPFADKMSPAVANLASQRVQNYSDGQLKWIIENGIRYTGMPGWKSLLEDQEMWNIVRYLRHLPPKGSLGIPAVYEEGGRKHEHAGKEHEHKVERP
jgi:mono/diheme cytochrome c family protein